MKKMKATMKAKPKAAKSKSAGSAKKAKKPSATRKTSQARVSMGAKKNRSPRTETIAHMAGNKIERIGVNLRKTYPAVGRAIKVIGDRIEHFSDK